MKKLLALLILTLILFLFPPLVHAQWGDCFYDAKVSVPNTDDPEGSPVTETHQVATLQCIPYLFQNLVTAGLTFAGIVALFFIVWGGYRLALSGGDAEKIKAARGTITYAILGLVLVFMSYFIVNLIAQATGATCLSYFGLNQCGTSADGKPYCPTNQDFNDPNFPYGPNECDCPPGTASNGSACVQ